MATDAPLETSDEVRKEGNELYKSGKFQEGMILCPQIKPFSQAHQLMNSDCSISAGLQGKIRPTLHPSPIWHLHTSSLETMLKL